jgi:hypothetical protein
MVSQEMSKPKVFISYSHVDADREWVREFVHSGLENFFGKKPQKQRQRL